jgi:hypothetical protein
MTKSKINLTDLTTKSLKKRILSADKRIYALREELARREKIAVYGTDTPELNTYFVAVEASFSLTVQAVDKADARRVVDEAEWLEWYNTTPGDAVSVYDWMVEPGEPDTDEEPDTDRDVPAVTVVQRPISSDIIH